VGDITHIDALRANALNEIIQSRMRSAKRWVWVTFQRAGFHRYPAASIDPMLESVSYLGTTHRHLFKFKVQIEIFHNDRDVEFHMALNYCESLLNGQIDLDYKSVEMLSDDLYTHLAIKYTGRDIRIEVSEDGECGCLVEYLAQNQKNN